jgi:hypothetical protein
MLFICTWVSDGKLGTAGLGSLVHVHGMVCFCGGVWVCDGQSTSSRYVCNVARMRAGRLLMGGMVAFQCCVGFPFVWRSVWGIWTGVLCFTR